MSVYIGPIRSELDEDKCKECFYCIIVQYYAK